MEVWRSLLMPLAAQFLEQKPEGLPLGNVIGGDWEATDVMIARAGPV